ncbi:hypothetical protein MYK68_18275 [Gordonia sp. PP30]|uniref:hypothetical protein n=1 Tax=Gordonia sp. PP30 TaxID=2935861 RepID=UPI0020000832|nr:hypothetical protein [Gordonia sp. PP30]UQE74636.1 hypothetical protein MYK68_18275 [Gordonia sp. PP30]
MALTPTERALRAEIAAHESWARTPDRAARTAPARKAALDRFEKQVDPDGTLPPAERARRAEHARKAYFKRLALKSAQARRKSREFAETAAAAERELAQAEHADLGLTDHQADRIGGEV